MAVQVEKLEKNMAKLTIEVSAEEFDQGINKAYQKMKNRIAVPGFRKGKAPRKMIEKMYGAAVFYEDAANEIIPDAYEKAAEECGEQIVSRPEISVVQIEEGKPFIFTAEVALKPEVTLGDYMGLEVEKAEVSVSEEEVDAEIHAVRERNSRTESVDRALQDGDIANLRNVVDGIQTMTVYKNVSDEAGVTLVLVAAILNGETPGAELCEKFSADAAFDTETYDNGLGVVPSYLLVPYSIDASNLDLLVETGNYEWDADHVYLVSTLG